MSSCCSTPSSSEEKTSESCCSSAAPRKAPCPSCGHESLAVETLTLLHQLKSPLNRQLPSGKFYFCASTDCDVVYFNQDGKQYHRADLRQEVGQKSTASGRLLCYCFDVHADRVHEELEQTGKSATKEFVVEMTKTKQCACDIRNPSGQCCLKDFPK